MNRKMALTLATILTGQFALAGQQVLVSSIGKNQQSRQINDAFRKALDIRYFFTVPKISYLDLSEELTELRTSSEPSPLVMVDYTNIHQEQDQSGESDLGLRLIVPSLKDTRANVSRKLAESGLVKTGDILLTGRPSFSGSIPYIHVQLGVTHAGLALVKTDSDGKKYVYNVDMPLNAEMLGPNRDSKLNSEHYMDPTGMFHIIRPRDLNDKQRANIAQWLELFVKRSASIYAPSPNPTAMTVAHVNNKIGFNYDYGNPSYDGAKKGTEDELKFVSDLARLAFGKPVPGGLAMYCSEFAWSVLSLRNCDPSTSTDDFSGSKTPACVTKIFEPMPVFGALYESQHQPDEAQFGMSDGPIILADVIKASEVPDPKHNGESVRSKFLKREVLNTQASKAGGLSAGHLAVQASLLKSDPNFYQHVIDYYNLTAVPNSPEYAKQIEARQYMRQMFNASNKLNYSPTAFFMHALMPDELEGQKITQKSMDYVATLYFLPPAANGVKIGGQTVDAYSILLNSAKNTK